MRISLNLTNYSFAREPDELRSELERVARAADEVGLDTLWVPDHLLQADPTAAPGHTEMFEAYTTLGYLAARTARIRLGTMVSAVPFRPPALLVKAVTTLDVLSGGRAWLGIGAGYQGNEARAMGLPLPPVAERFDRLAESLHIARRMWAGNASAFEGTYYRLAHAVNSPAPAQTPGPPILIARGAGHRTLGRPPCRAAARPPAPRACRYWPVNSGARPSAKAFVASRRSSLGRNAAFHALT
jgi:alkanesulfonate monooxygenase SsuD/methylene tetrahydromethanopterin reductase-like flavin-dependent oxidoreductase (luciferase family)